MANSRAALIYDMGERTVGSTRLERALNASQGAAKWFAAGVGMTWWNATMKSSVSALASTEFLQAALKVAKGGRLTGRDARNARMAGLTDEMLRRIAAEQGNFIKFGNLTFGEVESWADREAANAFRAAVLRYTDDTILTPGPQDAPLWMSTEAGKVIGQFKRFAFAANQRILLRAGQGVMNGDAANTLIALTTMVGLGLGVRALKDMGSHGEVQEREPGEWVGEAIDQSGVLGLFIDVDQAIARTGIPTPYTLLAGRPTRLSQRGALDIIAGPMGGLADDTTTALNSALSGEFTQRDLHKLRRLVPAQNVPFLAVMLDKAISESGLPR
jgi:hypothetical protein